jgi:Protein of unknown function (DUF3810)
LKSQIAKREVGVLLIAVAAALAPLPPALIERAYSSSLYPRLQRVVTSTSNLAPFALFDALIIGTLLAWLIAIAIDLVRCRGGWARIVARLLVRAIVWPAAFYLLFLLVWGLNYRRVPLADKLRFDPDAISSDAAVSLATTTVNQLNALHDRAHEGGWPELSSVDPSLVASLERTQRDLGASFAAVPGRPKVTLLDPYFRRAGVDGMTDPYFLETMVQRDVLPFERPFIVAHEWAHLAGFADESEANFVGWLTCLRASLPDRYSGWLFLYGELARAVRPRDRGELVARLAPGPQADIRATARRVQQQVNPTVSAAGWQVYDRYLKANHVEAGTASYAEVVRLVLGASFGPDWTPALLASSP